MLFLRQNEKVFQLIPFSENTLGFWPWRLFAEISHIHGSWHRARSSGLSGRSTSSTRTTTSMSVGQSMTDIESDRMDTTDRRQEVETMKTSNIRESFGWSCTRSRNTNQRRANGQRKHCRFMLYLCSMFRQSIILLNVKENHGNSGQVCNSYNQFVMCTQVPKIWNWLPD